MGSSNLRISEEPEFSNFAWPGWFCFVGIRYKALRVQKRRRARIDYNIGKIATLNGLFRCTPRHSELGPGQFSEVCSRETLRVCAPLPNPDTNATCFPALGTNVEGDGK